MKIDTRRQVTQSHTARQKGAGHTESQRGSAVAQDTNGQKAIYKTEEVKTRPISKNPSKIYNKQMRGQGILIE